jgi:hypothetical protein
MQDPLQLPERFAAVFSNATRGAIPGIIAPREDLLTNKLQACISPLNILCHCSEATYGQPCQLLLTLAACLLQSVASVDPFRAVVCRHVPALAGSVLEAQSDHPQASVFPVGTLVSLPTLWHFNRAGIRLLAHAYTSESRSLSQAGPHAL